MPFDAARTHADLIRRKVRACPACSGTNLGIPDLMYVLRCYDPDTNAEIEPAAHVATMPLAAIVCPDCTHVMLFNGALLGLVKPLT
jgi:hypothetical protein